MSDLTKILPGDAVHSDGWHVYFRGRWLVIYEDAATCAEMGVDHGSPDILYPDSLKLLSPANTDVTAWERKAIIDRTAMAMQFLSGTDVEIRPGQP